MQENEKILQYMDEMEPEFLETFHYAHAHPEVSQKEFETTAYITRELEALGIEILDYGLETGVVGLLQGGKPGPCIGLRADIDALPVTEDSTYEFPSENPGVMHACGHSIHYACLLGAAKILSKMRDQIAGSVKFLFQPAEEINWGAKRMVQAGCLENPHVDAIFGMHNMPLIPSGTVAVKNGPLMAGVNRINIKITGKGGHGGIPQKNVDPIVAASTFILAAQTVVARNISPLHSAVVSICNVRAGEGTVNNVTPEEVVMYGTVRSFDLEDTHLIEDRLRSLLESISEGYGCKGELEFIYELPVTSGMAELYDAAYQAVTAVGGKPVDPEPTTGGEDFSIFQEKTPGFFYWLGGGNPEKGCTYPWHSPHFKPDDAAIKLGAGVYAMSVFTGIEACQNGMLSKKGE